MTIAHRTPIAMEADAVAVPASVVGRIGHLHAVDVAAIPVRRGPAVSTRASRLGARGFTEAGIVHLPDEAGALDGPWAGPLLAHELTHAAQQRILGTAMPAPDSPEGQRLEAEAQAVEHWFAGVQPGLPPLRHLTTPRHTSAPGEVVENWSADDHAPVVQLAAAPPPVLGPSEEPPDPAARISLATALQTLAGGHPRFGSVLDRLDEAGSVAPVSSQDEERLRRDEAAAEPPVAAPFNEAELIERIGADPPRRWCNLDATQDLDELATSLYDRLILRLRFDVLVQRERSGTLMDFR